MREIVTAALAAGYRSEPLDEDENVWEMTQLVEDLSGRPWAWGPGNRSYETLRLDIRDFGRERVEQTLRELPRIPDASKLIRAAHDVLVPFADTKAITADAERKRKEAEQAEADRRRRAQADAEAERRRAMLDGPRAEAPPEWKALRDALPPGTAGARMGGDGLGDVGKPTRTTAGGDGSRRRAGPDPFPVPAPKRAPTPGPSDAPFGEQEGRVTR
jgi:hypothetical protein